MSVEKMETENEVNARKTESKKDFIKIRIIPHRIYGI